MPNSDTTNTDTRNENKIDADLRDARKEGTDGTNMQAADASQKAVGQGMTAGAKAVALAMSLTLALVVAIGLALAYQVSDNLNSQTDNGYLGQDYQLPSYEAETTSPAQEAVQEETVAHNTSTDGSHTANHSSNHFAANTGTSEHHEDTQPSETNTDAAPVVYIVTGDCVNVRPGPSAEGEPIAKLSIGQLVKGTGQISDNGKWAEILLPDNETEKGWVSLHYLQQQ